MFWLFYNYFIKYKPLFLFLLQVTESSSSVAMESTGFRRALNKILDDNIGVSVLTTDRSPSIRKIMRVDYQNIHHEFDVWHVAKGMFLKSMPTAICFFNVYTVI